jgi:hypothetical protein
VSRGVAVKTYGRNVIIKTIIGIKTDFNFSLFFSSFRKRNGIKSNPIGLTEIESPSRM